ncbi:LysR family transcriptional regulator [Micromonospora sp. WMMD1274]|uniref:LysR family transcriptional regulator n=1 Tax=Micromonospora sp. WMMD1274 TaxID=3404116 RepID=UPI003B925DA3
MRLELRHLRVLCAIADLGSLGKAASALRLSQPALSAQLRRIERFMGGELFLRTNSGVRPTSFGIEIVEGARQILTSVDSLGRRTGRHSCSKALRLGSTTTPVLAGLIARISRQQPGVSVTIRSEYGIAALLAMLESDKLDVALVLDYPGFELRDSEMLDTRPFAVEPAFVALPAGHRLAHRTEVPLRELAGEAWFVSPDDGAGWPGVFYRSCEQAGFRPAVTHEFLGEKNLQDMIAAGVGVTICQPTMKPMYGMVVRPLEGSPIRVRQLVVWRREGPAAPLAAQLHRYAREAYQDLVAQTPHYQAWTVRQRISPGFTL